MFDNFYLIAIVIIIMWLAALAFYLTTSKQQRDLQKDLESLNDKLGGSEQPDS